MTQTREIFKEVQERFNIKEVAEGLGLHVKKVGSTYRADSIDNSGRGENALALYQDSNSWFDFMLQIGGDITDLVAQVKFGGDIKQALHELLPDVSLGCIDKEIKARNEFLKNIERWHNYLFEDSPHTKRALEYLHSRRVYNDTIRELKIGVKVENNDGFRIVFPFWDVNGKNVIYFASRRYDWSGNRENEKSPKYKYAPLEYYPFLRSAPLGFNSLNRKNDDTLFITEGILDWLALYQEGYSVLAFKDGKFWKEVLEKIKKFKRVVLAYDSDEQGQIYTYKAAQILLQHRIPFSCVNLITKDVAEHYQAAGNLDAVINSAQQGFKWFINYIIPKKPFDDLTVGEKDDAMNKCKQFIKDIAPFSDNSDIHNVLITLRSYFPKDWLSSLFEFSRKGPAQIDTADSVRSKHDILYNPRTGFYEYQNPQRFSSGSGIWKKIDDEVIQGYIIHELGKFATGGKVSSILKLIKAHQDVHSEVPIREFNSLSVVNLKNGTLHIDINTGEAVLKPHSFYDYVTVQLPYRFDKNAGCNNWCNFVDQITNHQKDAAAALQEYVGSSLLPHNKFQKALMLKGGGSNGKSVFFNIISALLGGIGQDGDGYVSSTEPSKWGKDFRLMPLRHSWVNISSDAENDLRGSEGIFKKVVAGEVLEDSYKHKDPIPFKTRTKVMMACNYFPTVNDTSDGFMRRWLIIELPMHFVEKDKVRPFTNDRELDPFIEDKLMQELPGIFNWMLEGLQRLLKQGHFTKTRQQDELINEFRAVNNPLYSFVEENEESFKGSDEGHIIERNLIFNKFAQWADRNKVQPLPSNRFYSNMRSVFKNLSIPFEEDGCKWIFYYKEQEE